MFPPNITAAPPEVLKMISCKCSSEKPCSRRNCTCSGAQLSCTEFCACHAFQCENQWTVREISDEEDDGSSDSDSESEI